MDGTIFRELLINKYDIQVNKTSRKTVLFIVNIGANETTINYLITVLSEIANRLAQKKATQGVSAQSEAEQVVNLPLGREYHHGFTPYQGDNYSVVDMRSAYYAAFDDNNIEFAPLDHQTLKEVIDDRKLISASFVTPYPPGFPVVVPGQVITHDILLYLQKMRIKEIHGYRPEEGLKIFTDEYLQTLSTPVTTNKK
jgi:arginine decarboxylase